MKFSHFHFLFFFFSTFLALKEEYGSQSAKGPQLIYPRNITSRFDGQFQFASQSRSHLPNFFGQSPSSLTGNHIVLFRTTPSQIQNISVDFVQGELFLVDSCCSPDLAVRNGEKFTFQGLYFYQTGQVIAFANPVDFTQRVLVSDLTFEFNSSYPNTEVFMDDFMSQWNALTDSIAHNRTLEVNGTSFFGLTDCVMSLQFQIAPVSSDWNDLYRYLWNASASPPNPLPEPPKITITGSARSDSCDFQVELQSEIFKSALFFSKAAKYAVIAALVKPRVFFSPIGFYFFGIRAFQVEKG